MAIDKGMKVEFTFNGEVLTGTVENIDWFPISRIVEQAISADIMSGDTLYKHVSISNIEGGE